MNHTMFFIFFISLSICSLQAVENLIPVIISKIPHEGKPFTQGLAIEEGLLYESTGLYGQSSLRCLDPATGRVMQQFPLSSHLFAEGVAAFADQLFQVTWRDQSAFVYDRHSFKLMHTFPYQGEGWGLCRDSEQNKLWMSNGTALLIQRDPHNFAIQKTLQVNWKGKPVRHLNDLECVGNELYANIWLKDSIIRIDKQTGEVTGVIDASRLLTPQEKKGLAPDGILNGIAFRPETETFFITGKLWPWIFEVQFVPQKQ